MILLCYQFLLQPFCICFHKSLMVRKYIIVTFYIWIFVRVQSYVNFSEMYNCCFHKHYFVISPFCETLYNACFMYQDQSLIQCCSKINSGLSSTVFIQVSGWGESHVSDPYEHYISRFSFQERELSFSR